MTEKEFIIWLKGYIAGRLPSVQLYSNSEQILETIKARMEDITEEDTTILLDSLDPNKTNFA